VKKLTICAVCALATCACTPGQVVDVASALGVDIGPDTATLVSARLEQPADCNDAIARVWPPRLQGWARRIVWRESRNQPTAKNKRSTASGCAQLVVGTWNANQVPGCPWSTRFDPLCNIRTMWNLYQQRGAQPWAA
jgi:hypothetical protein